MTSRPLAGFERIHPVQSRTGQGNAAFPRVIVVTKNDRSGAPQKQLKLSAAARRMAGMEFGCLVEFLKKGTVIAIRESHGAEGMKLCKASSVYINRVAEALEVVDGEYPVWIEGGVVFFDLWDRDEKVSKLVPEYVEGDVAGIEAVDPEWDEDEMMLDEEDLKDAGAVGFDAGDGDNSGTMGFDPSEL